ncbi:helix-turn-helix domain-containing protein [Nocardia sp. NPDC127526]|uniref:helix-turn-helix domain-containing protein n=1 Tax=Nocardia sp. NPDC127526 TaxID=3345393 RepID=UPI003627A2D8
MYGLPNLIALQAAAERANAHIPYGTDTPEFHTAAEELLPHVFRVIDHLLAEAGQPVVGDARAHLAALMRAGHTQASISKASGVSTATISRIVNGATARPSTEVAAQLLAIPVEAPREAPVDAELLAKLERGEKVSVPFGQKDRYAELLSAAGADTQHIVHTLRMSYARAIKAQKAAA